MGGRAVAAAADRPPAGKFRGPSKRTGAGDSLCRPRPPGQGGRGPSEKNSRGLGHDARRLTLRLGPDKDRDRAEVLPHSSAGEATEEKKYRY